MFHWNSLPSSKGGLALVTTRTKSDTKKKGPSTEDRKQEHIRICLEREIESNIPAGFDDITLIHNAVPEINLDDVNLQCTFLGHKLQAPIMVTAMTGGHEEALPINRHIAQAVEALGLAMGVGSQRAAIEDSTLAPSFSVTRENAPTAFIIGNIGAPQLSLGYDVKEAEKLYCDVLGMEIIDRLDLGDAGEALFLDAGGVRLEIIPKEAFEGEERLGKTGVHHLSFKVDDVEKTAEELKSKGVEFIKEPFEALPGLTLAFFEGLNGVNLQLFKMEE